MAFQERNTEASPVDPQFYETVITRFSWWTSRDRKRTFVIAFIRYDDRKKAGEFRPCTVGLLELHKEEPVEREWDKVVDLYKAGELVKVIK